MLRTLQLSALCHRCVSPWCACVDAVVVGPGRYRETGTFILKGVDDLQTLLDEHVTMTQAMQFSAFKKPFEDRIDR